MSAENKYWRARCPKCSWEGSSENCAGGGSIADTGDYEDAVCPQCIALGYWIPVDDLD